MTGRRRDAAAGRTAAHLSALAGWSARRRRSLGFGAGLLIAMSLPPWGWWPAAIVGLGVVYVVVDTFDEPRARFATMWAAMLGFFVPGLAWMVDLTPPGYVVSVPIIAAIMAAPTLLVRRGPTAALAFPAALMLGEAWRWVIPFGGVPMSSPAMGQVGGPLLDVARAFGALGLVLCLAIAATAFGEAALGRIRPAVVSVGIVVVLVIIGNLAPDGSVVEEIGVAVVQGGGELGTRAVSSDEATVFERHIVATEAVPAGSLAVWPESALGADAPFADSRQLDQLRALASRLDITILTGVTERLDADNFSNAAVVVTPDGDLLDRYEKVHLVPFGEYIPLRWLIDPFADLSLIPREAIPGTGDARVDTPLGPVAVAISFEVYFGERTRDGVNAGGEIIANPTLASSYRTTHVPEQSLASARLRAVESGRWVLQSSTTGYSAIVDHDGDVLARTGLREAEVLTATAQRRTGTTWPVRTGKTPITALALLALLGTAAGPLVGAVVAERNGSTASTSR